MRRIVFPALLLAGLALSGCASAAPDASAPSESSSAAPAADCADGVRVQVAFGALGADDVDTCVEAPDGAVAASDALADAGVEIEGSAQYGDQIVCRVDDRPAADETVEVDGEAPFVEDCASMPPAYAYWALWQRASADDEWAYAQEGVGTLELAAGESIGLVWTTGTETPTPED